MPADPTSEPSPALDEPFPQATRDDWMKLVAGALKGRPFERLVARSYDGFPIEPIYERAAKAVPVAGRAASAPWRVMQRIEHPDAAAANAQALDDLENGATGLHLVFAGAPAAEGLGLPPTREALARALRDVVLDAGIAVEIEAGPAAEAVAGYLSDVAAERNYAPAATDIRFGFDPFASESGDGLAGVAGAVSQLVLRGFHGPFVVADGRAAHAAGGSDAQEIALALASAVALLRALERGGMHLDAARRTVYFRLAADADELLTIAKFRALRQCWARVEDACGLAPQPAFVAAETAWRMVTRRDPHVNMLRATLAAFSAAVGGADAITVLPFTAALGLPDAFARRVARNTQLLLLEESSLARVADPAAGSGAIEDLTRKLAATAWTAFRDIERQGGFASAQARAGLRDAVAKTRAAREAAIAKRTDVLTGTTEFPNLRETPPAVLAPLSDVAEAGGWPRIRLAAPFEALRDAADRAASRPRVLLAALGRPADFTARVTFARSLFEAGGLEAVVCEAAEGRLSEAFRESGARVACLCSSDEVYARDAETAARALAEAEILYLAGRPGDEEEMFRAAGVGGFVFAGCDVLATLRTIHDKLGLRGGPAEVDR